MVSSRHPGAKLIRIGSLVGLFIVLYGPFHLMMNPGRLFSTLKALAPDFPISKKEALSPLALRLNDHVSMLAGEIGERNVFSVASLNRAADYIENQLKSYGYEPNIQEYKLEGEFSPPNRKTALRNIEAAAGKKSNADDGVYVVGAHYDTAPGTPGADDNASAVAVLLELARLLKNEGPAQEIRLVAFSSEEPPSFGSADMGSYRYVEKLKEEKVKVKGMICLEMAGYYNPKPGSQFYPPFLHLFFPDQGDFIALVGNFKSRKFLKHFEKIWRSHSDFPLVSAALPSMVPGVGLSDHVNFWNAGIPALMLTDTAFFRNPFYHSSDDTPEKLDYEKMSRLTETILLLLQSI